MASRRIKLIASASAIVLGAGFYFLYSVFAVQGSGTLAQAPLNSQALTPPAFIMSVDDSNSMTFERLFGGGDGRMQWNSGNSSFFNNDGTFYNVGTACGTGSVDCYLYLFPHNGYNSAYSPGDAIPPLPQFGFARSHVYNAGYFNPFIKYDPWLNANKATPWPPADKAAAHADPRTGPGTSFDTAHAVTYNLEAYRQVNSETFSLLNGMKIPDLSGTGIEYRWCGTFGCSWTTAARDITSNTAVAFRYYPATFYLPAGDPAPTGYKAADANRPIVANACGPGCNLRRYEIKSTNYDSGYDAAIQNYANWFQYHRNRLLAMVGAMTTAMQDVNNMRVGYFTINNRVNVTMRDLPADRPQLYTSLLSLQAGLLALGSGGGTPNRDAVQHLGEQFRRTGDGAPIKYKCQRNGGMLFTDGYTNSGTGPTGVGNIDTGLGQPFSDSQGNTIADIAAKYYINDPGFAPLRTGVDFPAGQVPVPKAVCDAGTDKKVDCQTNLHMNFYGITLGARGSIYGNGIYVGDNPATPQNELTDAAHATPPNWDALGNPRDSDVGPTVDEIWHATLNTRGEFINAKTPADIATAMRKILGAAGGSSTPSGSIALTGARIGAGSLTVSPAYFAVALTGATDWYSKLTAQTVSTNAITGVATFTDVWEASTRLPAAADRNIWFANAANTVVPFNAANVASLDNLCNSPQPTMSLCTGAGLAGLDTSSPITVAQAVAYLKGEPTLENGRGGKLRFRTSRLGDIINSTPVVSAPTDNYGYRSLPAPYGASYATYLTTGKAGRRPMVYAGANDGMLHAFDGRETAVGGIERFAYIPHSVLGHTGNLLIPFDPTVSGDQLFQHRYFVDGPLTVSDAYYSGGWETVLVGTTGAGARGAFALNVSRASRISSDAPAAGGPFVASDRLWEINDQNPALLPAVRQNIGNILGRPVIVPVKTGNASGPVKWRAIFGNGYNSASGKAVLFMVDIDSGAPNITMIEAVEAGAPAGRNGLGNIVVVDRWGRNAADDTLTARTRDGFADTVYAADQKGAIWKFDLRQASPANLTAPLFTTLMYTAGEGIGTRQPILGGLTAASGPGGGVLVYFGTGSFSFVGDGSDTTVQSLYAVLDNNSGTTVTRANLLQQSIVSSATGSRDISTLPMTAGLSGWYLDLPTGERFVGYPRIESGIIFMPTYAPNVVVGCGAEGNNWLYGLNALTGAAGLSRVREGSPTGPSPGPGTGAVALVTGGTAPVKDVAVMTSPRIKPLGTTATEADLTAALGAQCSMVVQVAGAPPLYLPRACGRQSWRQIQ